MKFKNQIPAFPDDNNEIPDQEVVINQHFPVELI